MQKKIKNLPSAVFLQPNSITTSEWPKNVWTGFDKFFIFHNKRLLSPLRRGGTTTVTKPFPNGCRAKENIKILNLGIKRWIIPIITAIKGNCIFLNLYLIFPKLNIVWILTWLLKIITIIKNSKPNCLDLF